MSLDPRADNYVSRIFGQKNYMVVDHVQHCRRSCRCCMLG